VIIGLRHGKISARLLLAHTDDWKEACLSFARSKFKVPNESGATGFFRPPIELLPFMGWRIAGHSPIRSLGHLAQQIYLPESDQNLPASEGEISGTSERSCTMEFAIAIPQTYPDPGRIRRLLARAEQLPFVAAWSIEQVIGTAPVLESATTLTDAAGMSHRLRLGVAVLLIAQRNPVDLRKSLSSFDVLSEGRLIVGVGLGASTHDYPAYGLTPEGRVARFRENLEIMNGSGPKRGSHSKVAFRSWTAFILLNPVFDEEEQMERLAQEVLPPYATMSR
jgi:hypothetical protein